jgi:hypothetical protein
VSQRDAGRACEDKRVGFGSGELGQVAGQAGHDEVWEGGSAMPGVGWLMWLIGWRARWNADDHE